MAHGAQLVLLTHMGCQPNVVSQAQPDWGSLQPDWGSLQPATGSLIFMVCFSYYFVESWTLVYRGLFPRQ